MDSSRYMRHKNDKYLINGEAFDFAMQNADEIITPSDLVIERLVSHEEQFLNEIRNAFLPDEKKEEMESFVAGRLRRLVKS